MSQEYRRLEAPCHEGKKMNKIRSHRGRMCSINRDELP